MLVEQMQRLLREKKYTVCVVFALLLGYGFFLSYTSMYIDDSAWGRYFEDGRVLKQGRWGVWLWTILLRQTVFSPFIHKVFGIVALFLSCVVICCLFRSITSNKISLNGLIIFSCLMVTYSLANELLFYTMAQLCNSIFLLSALAVWNMTKGIKLKNILLAVLALTVGVSITEAAAGVYIIIVIASMILFDYYQTEKNKKVFDYIKEGMVYCGVLILSILLERVIAMFFCALTGWEMQARGLLWMSLNFMYVLKSLIKTLCINLGVRAIFYFPITEFLVAFVINICVVVWCMVKRRGKRVFLWAMFALSSVIFSIVQGEASPNRAIWPIIAIFISFICMFVVEKSIANTRRKVIPIVVSGFMGILVMWQIADLNKWEYVNFMRNNEETAVINDLGRQLQREYDVENKPVVFVGKYQLSDNILQYTHVKAGSKKDLLAKKIMNCLPINLEYQESYVNEYGYQYNETGSNSVISWGGRAFSEPNTELLNLFACNGYVLVQGTEEMYREGLGMAKTMPEWPKDGAIIETEKFILVNWGN